MRSDFELFLDRELRKKLHGNFLSGKDLIEVQKILEKYYFEFDTDDNRNKLMSEIFNSNAIKKYDRKEKLKKINEKFSNR